MDSARQFKDIVAKLYGKGLQADSLKAAGELIWRGVLLGTVLYLVLGENPDANLKLNAVSYIVAAIWAYYDGIFAKRMWLMAFFEAIFLHLAAVQVGNFLALLFGNPLLHP